MAQYPVAELQHVFKWGITLITQILQFQNGPILVICKCRFQNAKDLTKHTQTQTKYKKLNWKESLASLLKWIIENMVIQACCCTDYESI